MEEPILGTILKLFLFYWAYRGYFYRMNGTDLIDFLQSLVQNPENNIKYHLRVERTVEKRRSISLEMQLRMRQRQEQDTSRL